MTARKIAIVLVAAILVVGGILAYQAYQKDQNTTEIGIGPNGVSVD
jgi:predicted negative regulator of RcsB-dependent stress response